MRQRCHHSKAFAAARLDSLLCIVFMTTYGRLGADGGHQICFADVARGAGCIGLVLLFLDLHHGILWYFGMRFASAVAVLQIAMVL